MPGATVGINAMREGEDSATTSEDIAKVLNRHWGNDISKDLLSRWLHEECIMSGSQRFPWHQREWMIPESRFEVP